MLLGRTLVACLAAAAVACGALVAPAAAQIQEYRVNDYGGFQDVLPPGTNGRANLVELAAFLAAGARPPHNDDQRGMYARLLSSTPGVTAKTLPLLFKDASFGVRPGDQQRVYSPGPGTTIARDGFGVPHVYGTTRSAAMFGLGYAAAEDRLFLIDALRHAGRAELSSFAGGAAGNRAMDEDQWRQAPYTEADLQRQADQLDELYGDEGRRLQGDAADYVNGVNQYIGEARLDVTKMPGEYAAIGQPLGPDPWKATDIIATASLVGGIFGKGGGDELTQMELRRSFVARYGSRRGLKLWREWAAYEDADAPTTVRSKRFPYQTPPRKPARDANAIADKGSLRRMRTIAAATGSAAGQTPSGGLEGLLGTVGGLLDGLLPRSAKQRAMSNALVVAAAESASGHPLAVFGPQVSYLAPQILMEQDVHAPGIDARGAAFPGVNLYVQLGRGRDYAWSATSAGQDIIDTFAVELCEPDGSAPDERLLALPLPRRLRADRAARAHEQLEPDARRRDAAGQRDAARRAHEARARQRPGDDQGQARRLRAPALDVHARGRLGARLLGLQQPRQDAQRARLPARGAQDRLHVQLAVRRRPRHRVLQLGLQPAAREGHDRAAADARQARVARLRPRPHDGGLHVVRQAPADDQRPALPDVVEQQR